MNQNQIELTLEELLSSLTGEVKRAYEIGGEEQGCHAYEMWTRRVTAFLDEALPGERDRFDQIAHTLSIGSSRASSPWEGFWKTNGKSVQGFLANLHDSIEHGGYVPTAKQNTTETIQPKERRKAVSDEEASGNSTLRYKGFVFPMRIIGLALIFFVSLLVFLFVTDKKISWSPLGFEKAGAASTEKVVGIPMGAVIAFTTEAVSEVGGCKGALGKGWSEFHEGRGRFVLVAGERVTGEGGFKSGDNEGGEYEVTLKAAQMPSHDHVTNVAAGGGFHPFGTADNRINAIGGPGERDFPTPSRTEDSGGDSAHNNMPPFIALTWCKKSGE